MKLTLEYWLRNHENSSIKEKDSILKFKTPLTTTMQMERKILKVAIFVEKKNATNWNDEK